MRQAQELAIDDFSDYEDDQHARRSSLNAAWRGEHISLYTEI